MSKLLFIIFTIGFISIRMRFHNAESADQTEVKPTREKFLATQFSLTLLLTHGWWLNEHDGTTLSTAWLWIGAVCMGSSLPVLYWVHHSLGVYFSARLVLQPQHSIIQDGPYRWVRHPMYSVGFLYLLGAGLLSQSAIVLILPTTSFGLLVWMRIRDEEDMLSSLSNEYQQYSSRTGRFFPKIWL